MYPQNTEVLQEIRAKLGIIFYSLSNFSMKIEIQGKYMEGEGFSSAIPFLGAPL